jgi:hypothetical protein
LRPARLPALAGLALGAGWLMAVGWQSLIASSFTGSGATVLAPPEPLSAERLGLTLITGLGVLIAVLIERAATRISGRCIWPVWGLLLALLIGENLGIGLRLITLATVTLPAAVDLAPGSIPVIDLSQADLVAWALAGLISGGVMSLGLVVAMGRLEEA